MVTLTRENLKSAIPEYIRDNLRNNLTNPTGSTSKWIYKDNPGLDVTQSDYPFVLCKLSTMGKKRLGLKGSRYIVEDIYVNVEVYTDDPYHRDTIADELEKFTMSETSEDADGDTYPANGLKVKDIESNVEDVYINQDEILRVSISRFRLRYYGG